MKELYIYIMRNGMRSAVLVLLWVVTLFTQNLPAQSWQVGDIWPEEPHAAKLRKVTMAPPALSTGAVTLIFASSEGWMLMKPRESQRFAP